MISTTVRIELAKRKFREAMNTLDGENDQRSAVDSWILHNLFSPFEAPGFKVQMEVVRRGNVEHLIAVRFFGGPLGSIMNEMTVHFALVGMIFELEARRRRKFSSGHNPLLRPTTMTPILAPTPAVAPAASTLPSTPSANLADTIFDPAYTVATSTSTKPMPAHVPIIMVHTPSLTFQPLSRAGSGCGIMPIATKKRLERVAVAIPAKGDWAQGVPAR